MDVPEGIDGPKVSAWLTANVAGSVGPYEFERIAGGHSCLTFVVRDGQGRRLVLRRPPVGHTLATAHDVAREHRIISALATTGVPVAPCVGLCTDAEVNGAPFYVMEFVEGVVLHDAATSRAALSFQGRRRAGESLVDVLVALHGVDPDEVGLGNLAKRTDYLGRQLRRWAAQWEDSRTRELPGMERLHAWLVANRPPEHGSVIVHGDFRLGNAIHGPDGTVRAMLDWELCTFGDPLSDVSYLLRSWVEPGDAGPASDAPSRAEGFPRRDELVARYRAGSGRDLSDLDYWAAFNAWRSACIVEGVHSRYVRGVMAPAEGDDVDRFAASVVESLRAGLHAAGLDP